MFNDIEIETLDRAIVIQKRDKNNEYIRKVTILLIQANGIFITVGSYFSIHFCEELYYLTLFAFQIDYIFILVTQKILQAY